ncbi:MAG: NAD(P)-dependent alcohol dehydrogenase [Ilumatobacteraceae bacterium]|jgi:NADPH:quinone reductase-like Zn-dependent oxidoreductase
MPSPTTAHESAIAGHIPSTMTAVTARTYGGPEVLATEELPVPSPQTGELLVEVRATSLNALDWHFLTGTPYLMRLMSGLRRPKRFVRGADVAGAVVAVGDGVTRFRVGDSVFGEGPGGGCGQYLTVKEGNVVSIPEGVSFDAAAATPVAGLTALQGLRTHGAVQPGDRVLINGAAGGVGTMAVQIARALGAHVTAVCSTRNVDMVRSLGADEVLDYTRDDFVVGGARFDVMLDNVGNRRPKEVRSVMLAGGRYVAISGPKANRWVDPLPYIVRARLAFVRADASFHQFTAAPNIDDLTFLGELLASGRLVPQIDRVVGLDGVADGLAEIGSGHARAKIVVVP